MTSSTFVLLRSLITAVLIFTGSAYGAVAVVNVNGTSYGWSIVGGPSVGGTIGWTFTVGSGADLNVDKLGLYDLSHASLGAAHPVALWDSNQNLIAQATIAAGIGSDYASDYVYQSLSSSVKLSAGQTYYVGAYFPAGNDDKILIQATQQQFDSSFTYLNGRQTPFSSSQTGIAFPTGNLSVTGTYKQAFFGPTFSFTTSASAVPEPSISGLFFLGALTVVARRRR